MIPKSNRERAAEAVLGIAEDDESFVTILGVRIERLQTDKASVNADMMGLRRAIESFLDDLDRERTPPPIRRHECGFCGEMIEEKD